MGQRHVRGVAAMHYDDTTDPGLLPGDEAAIDYARELWKDRQPGEPDMTVFVKNAEDIVIAPPLDGT